MTSNKSASVEPDVCTAISWRGDGQFFVTNSLTPAVGGAAAAATRSMRVWSREAVLQSASAPFPAATAESKGDGVSGVVCWKPSGQLIATSQRTTISASTPAPAPVVVSASGVSASPCCFDCSPHTAAHDSSCIESCSSSHVFQTSAESRNREYNKPSVPHIELCLDCLLVVYQ